MEIEIEKVIGTEKEIEIERYRDIGIEKQVDDSQIAR
jgi:hypothetical protein